MAKKNLELKRGSGTQKRGAKGERRAALYLALHGYRIIERNYLFGHKEIDIIARKGDTVAFIEVKSRTDASGVDPALSVTAGKKRNLAAAANAYAASHRLTQAVLRFDVITVDLSTGNPLKGIVHYENAF